MKIFINEADCVRCIKTVHRNKREGERLKLVFVLLGTFFINSLLSLKISGSENIQNFIRYHERKLFRPVLFQKFLNLLVSSFFDVLS